MTRLSADVAASATSSTVENTDGFAANYYVVFGKPAQELSEIVLLTSVTANTTLGHTTGPVFAHSARTPLYIIKFNQVQIYSCATQTGTYALVDTVDLDIDEDYTIYDDDDGDTDTWYKVRYLDEYNTRYSTYSDPVQGTGYAEDSLYSIVKEIADDYGDPEFQEISRKVIQKYVNAGARKITYEIAKVVRDYNRAYKAEAMTSAETYDIPTRMVKLLALRANYDSNSVADSHEITLFTNKEEVNDQSDYSNQDPIAYWEGDTVGLVPTTNSTGYLYWYYIEAPATMDDVTDTHGLPYGARDLLVLFGLYRLWQTKNADRAKDYKNDFKDSLPDYIDFVAQERQSISRQRVKVVFGSELYE